MRSAPLFAIGLLSVAFGSHPTKSRAAKASKPNAETSNVTRQKSIEQEEEILKRQLTICRGRK